MSAGTVLVVDDEAHIVDVVRYALERDGFAVLAAGDGRAALTLLESRRVDLVVLDILMPELDGLSLLRQLRAGAGPPVILLSSRAEEVDRILGLELGGDDYVVKPFSPRELATRVKAVLRRLGRGPGAGEPILCHGPVEVDVGRHEVRVRGDRVDLTVTEFGLLRALLERPGRVLSRAQLIERAYLHDNHVTERTIDTHIRRLRAKVSPHGLDPVETVHGVGYRAAEPPA